MTTLLIPGHLGITGLRILATMTPGHGCIWWSPRIGPDLLGSKPIPTPWDRLDELGLLGAVGQRHANLANAVMQTAREVHGGVGP